ncbi:MAG TPA: type II and III secretion system protein [Burkholderiales bacterium]|nr:type II and III secretion system protein [Burkholderiales bacterium]
MASQFVRGVTWVSACVVGALVGCAQQPIAPSSQHIKDDAPQPSGTIPQPVQVAPVLPKPQPTAKPETYSVVVNRVPAQELLFALARDAKLQIDIEPGLTGLVTLNAIDQTLPQLLTRIARQIDMRYEIEGQTLVVMRDSPYLRSYKIDYLSAARNVKMQSTASTQFGSAGGAASAAGGAAGAAGATTGGTATIDISSENKLWESIVQNLREILRETDKVLPAPAASTAPPVQPPGAQAAPPPSVPNPAAPPTPAQSGPTFLEAASVIANRESGVLYVRATSKQHERVQEFLDQVMAGAKRQVLIEATVAEVQLTSDYQRGIDWQRLTGRVRIGSPTFATPAFTAAQASANRYLVAYASQNFQATLKLLEQFGDVRVLSSPKLTVLNNQTAILRVTRDIVYFTITPSTQPITIAGGGLGGVTVNTSFTTTPNIAAEGFMMAVLPQINDAEAVVLNVRPTIRRRVTDVEDPNPALAAANTRNAIPVFETREFDSMLRLQSGETAVLAGLMQDSSESVDTGIPGIRSIPVIGEALSQRGQLTRKTELVIFLRATVVRDASIDGDFREFREQLPGADFFTKPNPQRDTPPLGPGAR